MKQTLRSSLAGIVLLGSVACNTTNSQGSEDFKELYPDLRGDKITSIEFNSLEGNLFATIEFDTDYDSFGDITYTYQMQGHDNKFFLSPPFAVTIDKNRDGFYDSKEKFLLSEFDSKLNTQTIFNTFSLYPHLKGYNAVSIGFSNTPRKNSVTIDFNTDDDKASDTRYFYEIYEVDNGGKSYILIPPYAVAFDKNRNTVYDDGIFDLETERFSKIRKKDI